MLACEKNLEQHLKELQEYPNQESGSADINKDIYWGSWKTNETNGWGSWDQPRFEQNVYSGESMPNAFGFVRDFNGIGSINYYQLRKMSRQLFTENMYAGMVIGRLNTNVINAGLKLEADPSPRMSKLKDEAHLEWTSKTEDLFDLWASDQSVDWHGVSDLAALERIAFEEALIEGDVLRITRFDTKTNLPTIELVPGRRVQTAPNSLSIAAKGNRVINGVEVDKDMRHVAYHVVIDNELGLSFDAVRVLVKGNRTKRSRAQLIYYSPPPLGATRGFPLLSKIIQPLAQIGRYVSYELKAAEVNAALSLWVEKTKDVPGNFKLGPSLKSANPDQDPNCAELPRTGLRAGTIVSELAHGEIPHSFDTKRPNINLPAFKKSILQDIAAAIGIPPEVLLLMFENSFSASRQATIEMKTLVSKDRSYFAKQFNKPVYGAWLLSMVFNNKIDAPGYIAGAKTNDVFMVKGWEKCRFTGFIKQNVDILKEAKAYVEYINEGLMDRDQAAMELTGANHATVVKRLKKQNKDLAGAREPLLGDINTSNSRVEDSKGSSTPATQPKQPSAPTRKVARAAAQSAGLAVYQEVLSLMGDLDKDINSVDFDIDEMDEEKKD